MVRQNTETRSLRLKSIPVQPVGLGLSVMCTYYHKVPRRPHTFRYGGGGLDTTLYKSSSIISVARFDYDPRGNTYTLSQEQWRHFRDETKRLERRARRS